MTAIPDSGAQALDLLCDRCGQHTRARSAELADIELVWPMLVQQGWSGSPFATGTHLCPHCAAQASRHELDQATPPQLRRSPLPSGTAVTRVRDVMVVTPRSDITAAVAEEFRDVLAGTATAGRDIVVNLAAARLIDPSVPGSLVRAYSPLKRHGRQVCLASASRFVLTALHTVRLDTIFPIFDDVPDALRWLAVAAARGAAPSGPGEPPGPRPATP